MLHLLQLHYTAPEAEIRPHVPGHLAFLDQHHETGTFLVSGQAVPTSEGGAIIAHGIDRETVEQLVTEDPFVIHGVARYTITTVTPARVHPGVAEVLTPGA